LVTHTKAEHRLSLFEKRMLLKITGPKWEEQQEAGEKCIRSFMICTPSQILLGCYEKIETCKHDFGWEARKRVL
jgi:hypothetical protein